MPLINVRTSLKEISNAEELLKKLSNELALITRKPESYVMTMLQFDLPMTFAGDNIPCIYIEIKSIGSIEAPKMSQSFCKILESFTGVPGNRIYIHFEDVPANKWGFNGKTFG